MNPADNSLAEDLTSPGADQQPQPGADPAKQGVSLEQAIETLHRQMLIDRRLTKLVEAGGPIKRKDVMDLVTGFVTAHAMSPQEAAGVLADLPTDEDKVREWTEQHAQEADDAVQKLMEMIQGASQPAQDASMPPGATEGHLQALEALAGHLESLPGPSDGSAGAPAMPGPVQADGGGPTPPTTTVPNRSLLQ